MKDGFADVEIQIERAIDELEASHAAVEKSLHRGEKMIDWCISHRHVERRKTELAFERTATRGFDVNDALGYVGVIVKVVWKAIAFFMNSEISVE